MTEVNRYYEILELAPGASPAAVKQAYRRLVKHWHPDRFPDQPQAQQIAEERIKQINTAYAYLKTHPSIRPPQPTPPEPNTTSPPLDDPPATLAQWYYERGVTRAKQEDYAGAIADFGHAINLLPSYRDAYKYRGLVYSIIGNDRKANADLRRAAQLRPYAPTSTATSTSTSTTTTHRKPHSPHWHCAGVLRGHQDAVSAIALSPDGRYLVSGSYDETIRIWQLSTGRQFRVLTGHRDRIHCVAISPDGRWLASGSADQTIKLWNLQTGQPVRTLGHWLGGHRQAVLCLGFHPDRKRLVSGGADQTLRFWKLASGKQLRCVSGYGSAVTGLVLSVDGKFLITSSADKLLKIRQVMNGRLIRAIRNSHTLSALALSPDAQTLATGGRDRQIYLWRLARGDVYQTYPGHEEGVTALAYSQHGQRLVSGSEDGHLKLWDTATGQELANLQAHRDRISGVAITTDAQTLISASFDQTIRIWWRS
ncbi:MAG: DnaJ domain-containing protein [Spirulina sp. SIO3F2]|nr:DnaJ domain-containing protein [Spirulina sp. SIO3F2]